jgi:hypothetical protein
MMDAEDSHQPSDNPALRLRWSHGFPLRQFRTKSLRTLRVAPEEIHMNVNAPGVFRCRSRQDHIILCVHITFEMSGALIRPRARQRLFKGVTSSRWVVHQECEFNADCCQVAREAG